MVDGVLGGYSDCLQMGPDSRLIVHQPGVLRGSTIDRMAWQAVLGTDAERAAARWLIWESAATLGIFPDTSAPFLAARKRGEIPLNLTVPALNLRTLTYDMACAVFSAAHQRDAGAVIFELARSEIDYTDQSPEEYVAAVLAAAIKTGHEGPVFFQGDHFQVHAALYAASPDAEIAAVEGLIRRAIRAGFYNIDVGAAALVDYECDSLGEQFAPNGAVSAHLARVVREVEPEGTCVAIGAQVSPPWGRNSRLSDVHTFLGSFRSHFSDDMHGLDKISVHAGTTHGGTVLPDGSIAKVAVDFDLLRQMAEVLRAEYDLAGVVQYGVSTLPVPVLHKFSEAQICEIHLATGFQNSLFEHPAFPAALRREMYAYVDRAFSANRMEGMSDAQFYYLERKRALGHFKRELWGLDSAIRSLLRSTWEHQIGAVFDQLNLANSADLVRAHQSLGVQHRSPEMFGVEVGA